MLKPFYQGKLDSFCAIYAVLNCLRITHTLRGKKARDIFNDTLMGLIGDAGKFRDFLEQKTDYFDVVDGMLAEQAKCFPMQVIRPFGPNDSPDEEKLWQTFATWLGPGPQRAVLFRFIRRITAGGEPSSRHWTCTARIDKDVMQLFDCSHEAEAILNVRRDAFVTDSARITRDRLLYIQPDSVRLVRLPF